MEQTKFSISGRRHFSNLSSLLCVVNVQWLFANENSLLQRYSSFVRTENRLVELIVSSKVNILHEQTAWIGEIL